MKVVSYSYKEGNRLRFLYVDKDFNGTLPANVTKIIAHKKPHICREPIRLTKKEVALFKKNGYLLAPDVIFTELESA